MSNTIFYKIGSSAPEKNIPPDPCTNLKAITKGNNVELTWSDPNKITESEDGTVAVWSYSVLIRKDTGYPSTPEDGVEVCRSSILNQYQIDPYLDPITVRNKTYYYSVFAVSSAGKSSSAISVSIDVPLYRIMTVFINEADSNPATCCSYADDAIGMDSGKDATDWTEFFGYKPCLFKDGHVVGYLNPNNYAQFEDGTDADITSGESGNVMIEFPRRGLNISKIEDIVTVSMTDDPDNPEFTYYAHSRGNARKDYFYLGAYLGYVTDDKYMSLSGKSFSFDGRALYIDDIRDAAHNLGDGYELFTFYQLTFIQAMYVLQFKNLDSQTTVGTGYHSWNKHGITGTTDTVGMIYGDNQKQMKLFGIEDLWGNYSQFIDGFYIASEYSDYAYHATTDKFDTSGLDYPIVGKYLTTYLSFGAVSKVAGTSECGFAPIDTHGGSDTMYYCDHGFMGPRGIAIFGGDASTSMRAKGIFLFDCASSNNEDGKSISRLSFY